MKPTKPTKKTQAQPQTQSGAVNRNPVDLSGVLRGRLQTRARFTVKLLELQPCARLDAGLQSKLDRFNARVADYQAGVQKHEAHARSVFADIAKLDGTTAAAELAALRVEYLDLCRERLTLHEERTALLTPLSEALTTGELREAEKALADATADAIKKLEQVGYRPPVGAHVAPAARERAILYAARRTPQVQKAQGVVDTWKSELESLRADHLRAKDDSVTLRNELGRAFIALADGELV